MRYRTNGGSGRGRNSDGVTSGAAVSSPTSGITGPRKREKARAKLTGSRRGAYGAGARIWRRSGARRAKSVLTASYWEADVASGFAGELKRLEVFANWRMMDIAGRREYLKFFESHTSDPAKVERT